MDNEGWGRNLNETVCICIFGFDMPPNEHDDDFQVVGVYRKHDISLGELQPSTGAWLLLRRDYE